MKVYKIVEIIVGTITGVAIGYYIGKKMREREEKSLKVMLDKYNQTINDYTNFEKIYQENREKLDTELESFVDKLCELGVIVDNEKIDENRNPDIGFRLV